MKMILTIRAKLVGLALLVSLMIAGPLAVYTLVVERSSQIEEAERGALSIVSLLAETLIDPLYQLRIDQVDRLLEAARSNSEISEIYALDSDGLVLSAIGNDNPLLDQRLPGLDPILAQIRRFPGAVTQREGGFIGVTGPVRSPDGAILGFVHLHLSLRQAEERIAAEWRALAAFGGAAFLLGGLLAMILARQFTRPLREVMDATQSIRRGDFLIRVPAGRQDELGELAQAINKMAEDLQSKTVSKRYIDNIIRSSADTLIVTGAQGRIEIVNPSALAMLGYQPEQLLGQPVDQILCEGIEITAGNLFRRRETHYRTSTGALVPVSLSLAALTGDDGRLSGFVLAAQDITERKQLEMVLRRSEETLNRAQAVGQVGSWFFDIPANRLEWSAETYRMFGIPQQQAIDMETFVEAIHPDDRDFVFKAWSEAMAGAPYDIEHRIVVGGQERWVRERAQIERDAEGQPLTGVGTVQDITGRRKVEEGLRTLSTVVEQCPLSVVITDLDARILYVNPCFTNTTGYSREEAIGQNPRILQSGLTPRVVYTELWNSLTSGKTWRGELVNKRKNGELYWEEAHIAPATDSAGVTTHYVAMKLEISQRKLAERVLAESEERYRILVESSPFCVHEIDLEGRFQSINRAGLNMLGLDDAREICGKPYLSAVSQQDAGHVGTLLRDATVNGAQSHFEFAAAGDVPLYLKSCFIPIKNTNGKVIKLMGITEDITERKLAEEKLRESEASLSAILDNSPYLSWLKDTDGRYVKVNKAYVEYTRLGDIRRIIGKTDFDLWPRELAEKYRADDAGVMGSRQQKRVEEPSLDGGRMHWVESFKTPVIDENGNVLGTTGFVRDITERKQAEEQIRNLAFYDTLTQLPNRRLLNDRLGQTIAASKRSSRYGALMFIDLDNFKPLNDTYGHDVGDLLLIEVAHRLTSCVREVDTVARFGGDEFVVMLSELDADKAESIAQASTVAEKVRAILAESYALKLQQEGNAETSIEHHCTSSIGVVLFVNHEASPEEILKLADKAMYRAKEDGGNLVRFFDPES